MLSLQNISQNVTFKIYYTKPPRLTNSKLKKEGLKATKTKQKMPDHISETKKRISPSKTNKKQQKYTSVSAFAFHSKK